MGRPKVDYSDIACIECGGKGVSRYYTKGKCQTCYHRENFRGKSENPEFRKKRLEYSNKWNKENAERYERNKLRHRLSSRYGLSVEDFRALEVKQNNLCAICGLPQKIMRRGPGSGKQLVLCVDHDHVTGKVRGLLCSSCNLLVGDLETNGREILDKAWKYLEEHNDQ